MKKVIFVVIGVVLVLLGTLWFLQGLDLVHIKPILCFAECKPITGRSLVWAGVGTAFFVIGSIILGNSFRKRQKTK